MGIVGAQGGGNIGEQIKPVRAVANVAKTATAAELSVDRKKFNVVNWVLNLGAITGTSPTLDVKVQHSADNSVWVDAPSTSQGDFGAVTLPQIVTGDANTVKEFVTDLRFLNPFVRLHFTIGGTTPSFATAGEAILAGATEFLPV
jgi:hypothetical protein